MLQPNQQPNDFLTAEEAAAVEGALLTSRDKFTTRVAIYSLRVLKQIARDRQMAIHEVSADQISEWVAEDESLKQRKLPGLETDAGFTSFFARLVLSSLKPLNQIAEAESMTLEQVTPQQVIRWFEREAKQRLEHEKTE